MCRDDVVVGDVVVDGLGGGGLVAERTREQVMRRGGYSMTVVALFLLILLASALPLPQRAVAIVPIAVAAVISVRELIRLQRESAPALMRFGPFLTLGLVGMLLLAAATQVTLYVPLKAYEDCLAGANTQAAQAACAQERQQSLVGNLFEL